MLYFWEKAIQRKVEMKVPPLLAEKGYVLLACGRARPGVTLENNCYYRQLFEAVVRKGVD
jgi:hypothetical protein